MVPKTGETQGRRGWLRVGLLALCAAAAVSVTATPVTATDADEQTLPRLYQLLHDGQFTEPMDELGQKVRIWIWLDYMSFDSSQLRRLQRLGERFQTRVAEMQAQADALMGQYEAQLVPQYEQLYGLLRRGDATTAELEGVAEALAVSALSTKRDEALRTLRVKTLREVLSDEKEFLYTLSPAQEQRFVSSLFFLRSAVDPFSTPGTYRNIVGSTWNAGDFTTLLRRPADDPHLNIGGLWGIQPDAKDNPNYAHIQRNVVLFYVLKEPMLPATIEEVLQTKGVKQ